MILRPFKPVQPLYRKEKGEQATSSSVFALGLYIRLPELRSPYQVPPEICLIGSGSSMNAFQQGVANAWRISQGIIDSLISTEHSKTFVALVGSWPIRLSDGEMVVARTDAMSSGGSSSFEAFSLGLLEYRNFSRFALDSWTFGLFFKVVTAPRSMESGTARWTSRISRRHFWIVLENWYQKSWIHHLLYWDEYEWDPIAGFFPTTAQSCRIIESGEVTGEQ